MKIKSTVVFEYQIGDKQIKKFKEKVLERILEETESNTTLDEISDEQTKHYLENALPELIKGYHLGYCDNSIILDDYFNTIEIDYYGEDARNLVYEMADQIITELEDNENKTEV